MGQGGSAARSSLGPGPVSPAVAVELWSDSGGHGSLPLIGRGVPWSRGT